MLLHPQPASLVSRFESLVVSRNRAVPRRALGPVTVSIHGMRTFDADIGSCLQGLFLTHGSCTVGEAGRLPLRGNRQFLLRNPRFRFTLDGVRIEYCGVRD